MNTTVKKKSERAQEQIIVIMRFVRDMEFADGSYVCEVKGIRVKSSSSHHYMLLRNLDSVLDVVQSVFSLFLCSYSYDIE